MGRIWQESAIRQEVSFNAFGKKRLRSGVRDDVDRI
jgi:hypothetical protein